MDLKRSSVPMVPESWKPIRLGVSACLLGQRVRYDGGHKRSQILEDWSLAGVEWVSLCPEVGVGMPVPRETLRLEGSLAAPRLLGNTSERDWTESMELWSEHQFALLRDAPIFGYIWKAKSPSCGMESVHLFAPHATEPLPTQRASGVFARAWKHAFPALPFLEETQLTDEVAVSDFWRQVFRVFEAKKTRESTLLRASSKFV